MVFYFLSKRSSGKKKTPVLQFNGMNFIHFCSWEYCQLLSVWGMCEWVFKCTYLNQKLLIKGLEKLHKFANLNLE